MKVVIIILLILLHSMAKGYTSEEYCLAQNVWHEARGEAREGDLSPWLLVAFVTLRRVEDERWPNSFCEVVWDDKQFSWTGDALPDEVLPKDQAEALLWEDILQFSQGFISSYEYIVDPTEGANHYHSYKISPDWAENMRKTTKIGSHIAYKDD